MRYKLLFCLILFALLLPASTQTDINLLSSLPISYPLEDTSPTSPVKETASPNPTRVEPLVTGKPIPKTKIAPTEKGYITLTAVGDIMLGRSIGELIITEGFESPFIDTAETLKRADLTIGNLECPISERGKAVEKTYTFRAPLAASDSLAHAGFDLVSLANNHTLDYGNDALEDTLKFLSEHQIQVVGAGINATEAYAPVFMEMNGLKIAFLAFVDVPTLAYNYLEWEAKTDQPGVAWAHEDRVREGVQAAKQQADIVVVLVHNGYELVSRVNGYQQATAHLAIDSGASLVIGSHPHVLQRLETYKDGLIAYSMGNFVFDNFLFPPNYSAILSVELNKDGIQSFEMIDVVIQLNGVPQIMPYHFDH